MLNAAILRRRRLSVGGPSFGPDIMVNGGFDTAAGWTTEANWSISGGVLSGSLVVTEAYKISAGLPLATTGATYAVTFTVSNYSAGTVGVKMGGTIFETLDAEIGVGTDGTHTFYGVCGAGGRRLAIDGVLDFTGDVDDVIVREVL